MDTYIEFFTGMLGGFKTYSAVKRSLPHLAQGGHVYTNVEFNPPAIDDYLRKYMGVEAHTADQIHYLTTEQIREFPRHIRCGDDNVPVMVIADEAHLLWGNMDWAAVGREVLQFITLTRKFRVHVILISQHPDNVAKQFRRLVQFYWTFRDIRKLRIIKLDLPLSFLPLYQAVCVDAYSKMPIRKDLVKIDKRIFPLYSTRQIVLPMSLAVQPASVIRVLSWEERHPWAAHEVCGIPRIDYILAGITMALLAV